MSVAVDAAFDLVCYGCGFEAPQDGPFTCPKCGEPTSLRALGQPPKSLFEQAPRSLWHYKALLPIRDESCITSIGEGATPLVEGPRLAAEFGLSNVMLKYEAANPTGSFKDRQIAVGISRARELGKDTVAVVSSGNVACAASAFAARSGLRAVLFMHGLAGPGKTAQAAAYGAKVLQVNAPPSAVFDLCIESCSKLGWYHLSTAGLYEPYNVEGAKTIAYEIFHQSGGNMPKWIVAPVGGGGLLGGIWRGLMDLQRLGLIAELPRLVGVQAAGCAPLVDAIADGTPFLETLKNPWPNPHSVAGGIADDIIFDGHTVLPAIRRTNGKAIAVTDDEILDAEVLLASKEGLLVEPSCSVVVAALKHLKADIGGDTVCCILTGTGIKELGVLHGRVAEPTRIDATLGAVQAAVK